MVTNYTKSMKPQLLNEICNKYIGNFKLFNVQLWCVHVVLAPYCVVLSEFNNL